jgi:hypothetical protein
MPSLEKSGVLARSVIGAALWLCLACLPIVQAQEEGKPISMAQAVDHALQQSQLTLPGNKPFHLKAHIAATGAAKPEYTADVEEFWAGPQKWQRVVTAKGFSQTLIVNGESVAEKVTGDYYPFWLHDLVTAIFDPLPMAEQLKRMNTQVEIPEDSIKSQSCVNMQSKVGVAPAQNTLAYAFCFGGKLGLIQAAITPGYKAQFADHQPFKNQMVARTITADFAPGLTITAKITELTELANPDETMFAIDAPTPLAQQIRSSQVGEESARISTDRSGQVREVWPLGSGNAVLSDAAREQVLRWQYKPFMNGGPTQMEAVLTFAFSTKIENPVPVLTNAEARKLATRMVPPVIAPGKAAKGTKFSLRASVDETGVVKDVQNPNKVASALWVAGSTALKKWRFRPYMNHGKPDRFYAEIVLEAP